ncbi:TolC family protein [Candidatus Saganbacteria bacterium]|nr:TolC family protein [Candidatus Saganbacteria bacterium]
MDKVRFGVKFVISLYLVSCILCLAVNGLTLKESINIALKNNPAVIAMDKKNEAAKAKLAQAVGAFFPTLKIDGNISRDYSQPATAQITSQTSTGAVTQTLSFGTDATAQTKAISVALSQPIFVPALFPGYKIAQRNADISNEELKKTIQATSYDVTVAYYGIISAKKLVALSEDSLTMARSHLDQVKTMLSTGSATRTDTLRSEVQLANAEAALTKAKNTYEVAKASFNNVLGKSLDETIELTEDTLAFTGNIPDYNSLLKAGFVNKPEYKQFLFSKDIAESTLQAAQTGYLPTVFLSGNSANRITDYPTFTTDVRSWQIVGAASWTLFDGLGLQNRIREAAANLDSQKASEEQIKNGIALEVRSAYLNLKSDMELIVSAKKAVDYAEENYKLSNFRYTSGVGTNLEVLDAQVALTQAKTNYLKATFDLEIDRAKLNKILGTEVL